MPDEKSTRSALEQLAKALRSARLQRDLTIEDVGRLVKIRSAYIEKLEAADFSFLPPLYAYSHLRKYAGELGVGSKEQLEACREELGIPGTRFSTKPAPADEPAGSGSKRTIVLIVAVVSLVLALLALAVLLLR